MATYACALVGDIDESAVDWDPTPGGSEIDDEFTSAISAVDLLGGASGIPLEDYADLYDPTLAQTLHQLDLEVVDAQLGSLQDACETEDLSTPEADVSHDGRLSFACTLIADVNDADSTPTDWFRAMADESPSDEGFTLTKIFGAVSLTGGTASGPGRDL